MSSFTLIELLVVIAIIGIIGATVVVLPPRLQQSASIDASTENVVSALLEARTKTLASKDDYAYGVHVETAKIVVFKGASYSSSSPDNEITLLPADVSITAIALAGGGSDVLFNRLTGDTNQNGTITLRLVADTAHGRVISVTKTGLVYSEAL